MRHRGFILLTTLMMMMTMLVLVLSLMQLALVSIKALNQNTHNHRTFRHMEQIATQLDIHDSSCVVEAQDANQLMALVLAHSGCLIRDDGSDYRYLIADLGILPCLQIMQSGTLYSSHHWLLTLFSESAPEMILQIRLARPVKFTSCNLKYAHFIQPGVISWRKLSRSS